MNQTSKSSLQEPGLSDIQETRKSTPNSTIVQENNHINQNFNIKKEILNHDLDKLLSVLSLNNNDHLYDEEIEKCKDLMKKSK